MGKKNKKAFYKNQLKPFLKDNRVILSALGGVAAGITLANLMGTEKAQEVLHTVENSISNFTEKVAKGISGNQNGTPFEPKLKKESVTT
ncbi:MAG: hypothetical protein ABIR06_08315 [Cyclobacteriaceae bacterium]